jgi:hypothetical protein
MFGGISLHYQDFLDDKIFSDNMQTFKPAEIEKQGRHDPAFLTMVVHRVSFSTLLPH